MTDSIVERHVRELIDLPKSNDFNGKNTTDNKMKRIREIIIESALDSTGDGIPHIFRRENKVMKGIWITSYIICAGFMIYMSFMTVSNYLEWETVVKTEYILEIPTKFPSISFCNINPFYSNYSSLFVQGLMARNNLTQANYLNYKASFAQLEFRYIIGLNILSDQVPSFAKPTFGLQLSDMLLDCNYNLVSCSADDFTWYFDPLYGNCYTFNGGKNASGQTVADRVSVKAGLVNSFNMELFLGNPTDPFSLSVSNGIHLEVHNKSHRPFFYKGIQVPVGTQSNVIVSREFSYRLEQPYSECQRNIEKSPSLYVQTVLNTGYEYRQSDCFNVCFQQYLMDNCGCYDLTYPIWSGNYTPCLSYKQVYCDGQAQSSFFSQDVKALCGDSCPLECDTITYGSTWSGTIFPSEAYATSLRNNKKVQARFGNRNNMTTSELRKNLVSVFVYYDDLIYKAYTEKEKMSVADLVSNVGGTIGLFLGLSFLSFLEIFDVLFHICLFLYAVSAKNRVTTIK